MAKKDEPDMQDTKTLNEQAEQEMVDAQWERAKNDGLLDLHPESINSDKPKE